MQQQNIQTRDVTEIVIVIAGGQVQNIISKFPMNVIIANHDTEGADESRMYSFVSKTSDGKLEALNVLGGRTEAEVNPEELANISAGLDASSRRVEYLTYDEFCDRFNPITNNIRPDAPLDGAMFETFGAEEEVVKKALITRPAGCVWTLMDGDANDELCQAAGFTQSVDGEWMDGEMGVDFSFIGEGLHYVNRQGYLITEVPAELGVEYVIYMADELVNAARKGV